MICNVDGCDRAPMAALTLMCVHEHRRTGPVCAEHFNARDAMSCYRCWFGTDPHLCRLDVLEIDFTNA